MQTRNALCECGSGKKHKNCCEEKSSASLISKYGYKCLIIVFACFFIGSIYFKYVNAEPTVWCYECNRYVLESSKGHKTEPLEN